MQNIFMKVSEYIKDKLFSKKVYLQKLKIE